jgi:glycosyltransferase involved in cell wall biosynthesis
MTKRRLVVLNYAMDDKDPIFSHQLEAVRSLGKSFDETIVITSKKGDFEPIPKTSVFSVSWKPGQPIRNVFKFYSIFIPIFFQSVSKSQVVFFSHMTEVQASLVAPLIWLFRKTHILWYAHTSKSPFLIWCSYWVSNIVTSTVGSCPIRSNKIVVIGQAIDLDIFQSIKTHKENLECLVHLGRFDPSKNIIELIATATDLRKSIPRVSFTQIGNASCLEYSTLEKEITSQYASIDHIKFLPNVERRSIPNLLSNYGCFIHAFIGSLDKALLEATALRIPVITKNIEYQKIFGSWQGINPENSLESEFLAMYSLETNQRKLEIERRYEILKLHHSLNHWSGRIVELLKSNH